MISTKWWFRNNTLLSLLTRTGIIVSFTILFSSPQIAGIVMLGLQFAFTLYFIVTVRYTKIRYFIILAANSLLMIGIILATYLGATSPLNSSGWLSASKAYMAMYFTLVMLFFVASMGELVMRH